jgi:hypothetical protein
MKEIKEKCTCKQFMINNGVCEHTATNVYISPTPQKECMYCDVPEENHNTDGYHTFVPSSTPKKEVKIYIDCTCGKSDCVHLKNVTPSKSSWEDSLLKNWHEWDFKKKMDFVRQVETEAYENAKEANDILQEQE